MTYKKVDTICRYDLDLNSNLIFSKCIDNTLKAKIANIKSNSPGLLSLPHQVGDSCDLTSSPTHLDTALILLLHVAENTFSN